MTQIEKTIIRLYRDGYVVETIAQAIGEDRSYVGFVLDSYFGQVRAETPTQGQASVSGQPE